MKGYQVSALRRSSPVWALFSGLLTAVAMTRLSPVWVWCCYIPLMAVLQTASVKSSCKAGAVFGLALAIGAFAWMIPGAGRFSGHHTAYGWIAFAAGAVFLGGFFALTAGVFAYLKAQVRSKRMWVNVLLIASVFCLAEALLDRITTGWPWIGFHAGLPLAASEIAIQPAAWVGVYGLSFAVVAVNYLITAVVRLRAWRRIWIPAVIIVAYLLTGQFIRQSFEKSLPAGKRISVAILTENTPPETKWDDQTGNRLAAGLLKLSREAAALKPDVALWSESAIPWTYRKDDDLVAAILKSTAQTGLTHILGMNTATSEKNVVYNSAYAISANGEITGRYDKQVLLSLIEKPVDGLVLPFRSSAGFTALQGTGSDPLSTAAGNIGILICNESTRSELARLAVQKGATLLCNLSNDGWFSDTYLAAFHFYNARLRAVESRKDIVVNSNLGYSGLIQASGKIMLMQKKEGPAIAVVSAEENNLKPLSTRCPLLLPGLCLGFLIVMIIHRKLFNRKDKLHS